MHPRAGRSAPGSGGRGSAAGDHPDIPGGDTPEADCIHRQASTSIVTLQQLMAVLHKQAGPEAQAEQNQARLHDYLNTRFSMITPKTHAEEPLCARDAA